VVEAAEEPPVLADAPAAGDPDRPRKRPLGRRGAAALGVAGGAAAAGGAVAAAGAGTASGPVTPTTAERDDSPFDLGADEATRVLPRADTTPDWLRDARRDQEPVADDRNDGLDLLVPGPVDEPEPDEAGRAATTGAAAATGGAVVGALGSVGERVGGFARRAVDKVSELSPDTAPREATGDLEAPAPLVPAEPLTKDESKLALGIVVGFLVLALVIGIYGVSRIGSGSDSIFGGDTAAPATRTTTVAPSSAAPTESGASPSNGTGTSTAEPLAILKVEAYDPEGDGAENNNLTPKVYDGDPSTGWFSENYRSDTFGGLKKGLGVIVDLGPNKKPQTVELDIPHPSDVEVYVGPDNRLEGATKIGEKTAADGTVTFQVPPDVSGQYIVVWFTKLYPDDNGKRRAWLDEVVVTG
jgi:hypothetical protein